MNITPWRERADCDWQAEIDELRAAAATDAHLLELAQDTAKRLCDELAALKAHPVQKPLPHWYTLASDGLVCLCASEDDAIYEAKKGDVKYPLAAPHRATRLYISALVQPAPLTDADIHKMWASENGLEDCDMCYLYDFKKAALYFEARVKTGGAT